MILTAQEIITRLGTDIILKPYRPEQLNPNSYNLRLADEILIYDEVVLDPRQENRYHRTTIHDEGMILEPGTLYLGRTEEYTETHNLVPLIEGRSSCARLGLSIHVSAGFGDVGFCGFWTLELTVAQPCRVYKHMQVGQIFYHTIMGDPVMTYDGGKYQRNQGVQPCMMWKEFR